MILYAISDRRLHRDGDLVEQCSHLIRSGIDWLQIREKDIPDAALLSVLRILVPEARRFGVKLLVNGRVDLSILSGASGVHLPSSGIPTKEARKLIPAPGMVVRSCHNKEEILEALEGNADAVTLGPVFETPSKLRYGKPMGLKEFVSLRKAAGRMKVIALGGIETPEKASEAVSSETDGFAAIRLFCTMKNAIDEVPALRELLGINR